MSILFDALNKAARDYRRHNAPVIVPLITRPDALPSGRRVAFLSVIAALFIGGLLGFALLGGSAVAKDTPNKPEKVQGQDQIKTSQPARKFRKTSEDEPMGIALSEASDPSEASPKTKAKKKPVIEQRAIPVQKISPPVSQKSVVVAQKAAKPKDEPTQKLKAWPEASMAIEAGDWDKALKIYDEALRKNKKDREAVLGKVFVHEQRGGDEDLEALDDLVETNPSVAQLHAARARILVRQKDTLEALSAWQRAVDLDPKNKSYRLGLAILNDRLGREEEAIRLYREVPGQLPAEAKKRLDYLISNQKQQNN